MSTLIATIVGLILYFLPTGAAVHRRHKNFVPIFLVNFVLGWTVVCWLWALIWATTNNVHPKIHAKNLTGYTPEQ